MRTYLSCIPCIVRQAFEATELAAPLIEKPGFCAEDVMRQVLRRLSSIPYDQTPAHMAMEAHRIVRVSTGVKDPYKALKEAYNSRALDLLPKVEEVVKASSDPFDAAVRLAIAGNIIDFGYVNTGSDIPLDPVIKDSLERPFSIDHVRNLTQELERAELNAKLNSYIIKEVVLPVVLRGGNREKLQQKSAVVEEEEKKSWRERLTETHAPEVAVLRPKNQLDDISERLDAAVQQEQVVIPPNADQLFDEQRVQRTADSLELKKKK